MTDLEIEHIRKDIGILRQAHVIKPEWGILDRAASTIEKLLVRVKELESQMNNEELNDAIIRRNTLLEMRVMALENEQDDADFLKAQIAALQTELTHKIDPSATQGS